MAKVTNAFDTYTATADREQLSDVIYNISPTATPVMSAIGRNNVKKRAIRLASRIFAIRKCNWET